MSFGASSTSSVVTKEKIYTLCSDPAEHFTEETESTFAERENLAGLVSNKIKITRIVLIAKVCQNFNLFLFGKDPFEEEDLDKDSYQVRMWQDLTGYSRQIGGAGWVYYDSTGGYGGSVELDYEDEDGTKELHLALRSEGKKSAHPDQIVKICVTYIPREE